MISIAMTTYNGEKFVGKQLESIRLQTKKPDEVIIVDDCSTDSTAALVRDFIETNQLTSWRLITLPGNKGFIHSFNRAIAETRGDIIFLCDHDDIWLPDKVEIMSDFMTANSEIIVLTSGFYKIDSNDQLIRSFANPFSSNHNLIRRKLKNGQCARIDLRQVIGHNVSPGCTSAFKSPVRDVLKKLEEPEYNLVHDWKINIIGAAMNGLYFLNTQTIKYRLHDTNAIGLQGNYSIEPRIKAYEKACDERALMKNIIKGLISLNSMQDKNRLEEALNQISEIELNLKDRLNALNTSSISSYVAMLFKFNFVKARMLDSWGKDVWVLAKSKFSNR